MKSFIFYLSIIVFLGFPKIVFGENRAKLDLDLHSKSNLENCFAAERIFSTDNSLLFSSTFKEWELKTFASFNISINKNLAKEEKTIFLFNNGYLQFSSFRKQKFFSLEKILVGNFSTNKTASRLKKPQFNFPDAFKSSNLSSIGFGQTLPTLNTGKQNFGVSTIFAFGKKEAFNLGLHWYKENDTLNNFSSVFSKSFKFSKSFSMEYSLGLALSNFYEIKDESWWFEYQYFDDTLGFFLINELRTSSKLTQSFLSLGLSKNPYGKGSNYLRGEFSVKTSMKNPFFLSNFGFFICDKDYFTLSQNIVKDFFKIYINPQFQFFLGKGKSLFTKIGFLSGMSLNQEKEKSKNEFWSDIWKMSININYSRFNFLSKTNFENMFYFNSLCFEKPLLVQSLQLQIRCPWEDFIFRYYTIFASYENDLLNLQDNGTWNFKLKGNFLFDIKDKNDKLYKISIRSLCVMIYRDNIESWELEGKMQINKFTMGLEGILPAKESSRQGRLSLSLSWQIF